MFSTITPQREAMTVRAQSMRSTLAWLLWFGFLMGITGLIALMMYRRGPSASTIGWILLTLGAVATLYQPRYGVYLLAGLTLIGDRVLIPWYPFVKNFSSGESLLYINKAVIFSPAEAFIVLTGISWLGRAAMQRKVERWHSGPLFWPALIFIGFITFALFYGLQRGGNRDIGLQEARSLYYMVSMIILTGNLITKREHVGQLLWFIVIGLILDATSGFWLVASELRFDIGMVDKIAEHPNSIHLNTMFVLLLACWIYRSMGGLRLTLLLALPILLTSYLANQRRAAFITLIIAFAVLAAVLFFERRNAFWLIVPSIALLGTVYLGAFWNNSSIIGLPASAVRSVVSPSSSGADYSSDRYRVVENMNTRHTIGAAPLTGVGFGQKFYMVQRLPQIDFIWWEYITHNTILWIWMKAGLGGFLALLYLIGSAIITGTQLIIRLPGDVVSVAALTATAYVVMHFVFAYVDMSWESQSMIYIGTMIGLLNSLERIVSTPSQPRPRRWPWQPEPAPPAGLRPV
jgi:hypothetical protein